VTARDREAELAKASVAAMTSCERQVRILGGGTSKSIAKELGISPRTVEMHRARVMERLGAKTLSELILLAAAAGLRLSAARETEFDVGSTE
jgi:FixJ family two-component response regulator